MIHPDFMVVGAMRCGTTKLHGLLDRHTSIAMSRPKEPHHFVAHHYARFCGPGDQWVADQVVTSPREYERIVTPPDEAMRSGEASATYLHYPDALARIAREVPDVRIVALLREPAARAHSAYWYLRSQDRERVATFEEGLDLEPARVEEGYGPMWHYVRAGRYAEKLRACYELFGRDRIHVATTDAFRASPDDVLEDLWKLLDVAPQRVDERDEVNASGAPRSAGINRLLNPPPAIRRTLRRLAPAPAVRAVLAARRRNLSTIPPMDLGTEARLRRAFDRDVAETARLTGLDLSAWGY